MSTEAQIYAIGTCAIGTCAIAIIPNRRNTQKSTGPYSQKVLVIRSITLFLFALMAIYNAGRPGLNRLNTKYEILNTNYYAKQSQFAECSNERK